MTLARDNQKQRVYDAERDAAVVVDGYHYKQTIPNHEVQPWVDAVLSRKAIRARWGNRNIYVGFTHGGGHAHSAGEITLGRDACNPWYILHEIAHCLMWGEPHYADEQYAPHGPEFAGLYLWLVRNVMGEEASKALLDQYRVKRVRRNTKAIHSPTRTVVTKAEKAAKARAVRERPLTPLDRENAAETLRRAVKLGMFGPSGSKPRTYALSAARTLEEGKR